MTVLNLIFAGTVLGAVTLVVAGPLWILPAASRQAHSLRLRAVRNDLWDAIDSGAVQDVRTGDALVLFLERNTADDNRASAAAGIVAMAMMGGPNAVRASTTQSTYARMQARVTDSGDPLLAEFFRRYELSVARHLLLGSVSGWLTAAGLMLASVVRSIARRESPAGRQPAHRVIEAVSQHRALLLAGHNPSR